jgi:hypothetical protein
MIEAYNRPDSKIVLKTPIEYYQRECEDSSSENYAEKNKACGGCILLAIGLRTVWEEEGENEGGVDDAIEDLKKQLGQEDEQKFSWLD